MRSILVSSARRPTLLNCCALVALATASPAGAEEPPAGIDTSPLPVTAEKAFPELSFKRPIVLTHAGDGSNRVFIASQLGEIHVLPNDQSVGTTKTFLDLTPKVTFTEPQNEEGVLGLCFHPKYASNGEFFVCYTTRSAPHTSVISRFRVSPDDPDRADPEFEQEILRVPQPYWNHNGGTICFGPDGYLYVALGDGGAGNDPHMNGQNLQTLLGKILRIDVDGTTPRNPDDHRSVALEYRIPADNPFVGNGPLARGEIWAYGLRNVWRMAFDRQTGTLWAGDPGQNRWEEIDLIVKGGNYGWNLREGAHPFGPRGAERRGDLIDPIFEYHHDVGKSIIGGNVYRGKLRPELAGGYLYADYVTGQVWALWYDEERKAVTANRPISGNTMPIVSFGEDEQGETYFMTDGGSLHCFQPDRSGR